jgi:hypothetical protein
LRLSKARESYEKKRIAEVAATGRSRRGGQIAVPGMSGGSLNRKISKKNSSH